MPAPKEGKCKDDLRLFKSFQPSLTAASRGKFWFCHCTGPGWDYEGNAPPSQLQPAAEFTRRASSCISLRFKAFWNWFQFGRSAADTGRMICVHPSDWQLWMKNPIFPFWHRRQRSRFLRKRFLSFKCEKSEPALRRWTGETMQLRCVFLAKYHAILSLFWGQTRIT